MKGIINTIVVILLLTSCSANVASDNEMTTASNVDSVGDYTANVLGIEQKKAEMLAADSVGHFLFSDDIEFQSQDPHAYWLMNRLMLMVQLVETADDDWAWMLAMNECVKEYNTRLGRKIGSVDAAANAIEELIDIYNAGNQPEMNTASYVESILEHYKTVYAYYDFIELLNSYSKNIDRYVQMPVLYYREFKEWFDLNNAVNAIMYYHTYADARYSSLPMDMNGTFEIWSKKRFEELEIEQDICCSYYWTPFNSDATTVSVKEFDELLSYFKDMTRDDVVEEMLGYYETALTNWREVREQIALILPEEKQKSYREITKQMHTRFYDDLFGLK